MYTDQRVKKYKADLTVSLQNLDNTTEAPLLAAKDNDEAVGMVAVCAGMVFDGAGDPPVTLSVIGKPLIHR